MSRRSGSAIFEREIEDELEMMVCGEEFILPVEISGHVDPGSADTPPSMACSGGYPGDPSCIEDFMVVAYKLDMPKDCTRKERAKYMVDLTDLIPPKVRAKYEARLFEDFYDDATAEE